MALSKIIKENDQVYTGTDPLEDAKVAWWKKHRDLYHVDDSDVNLLKIKDHSHDEIDPFDVFGHGI